MAKRGYQENFYNLYEKFQDTDNRRGKADKTIQMLLQHSGVSLDGRTAGPGLFEWDSPVHLPAV